MATTLHLHEGTSVVVTETPQEIAAKLLAASAAGDEIVILTSPNRLGGAHFAEPVAVTNVRYAEVWS